MKTLIKLMLVTLPVMGMLFIPETLRNIRTYDALYPSSTGASQLVGTIQPKYLLINGMKNYAVNLPALYMPDGNSLLEKGVCFLANQIKVDINAECISEGGEKFQLRNVDYGHDTAVNTTVVVLFTVCVLSSLFGRRMKGRARVYTVCVIVMFLCLCLFMRWNAYVSRYMLPYLAAMCPMIAFWCEDISRYAKSAVIRNSGLLILGGLGILGLISLFSYHGKIAASQGARPEGYFTNRYGKVLAEEYEKVCSAVMENGDKTVGLILGGDSYEYPIQYLLQDSVEKLQHIMVDNPTAQYEDAEFLPDGIITTEKLGDTILYKNKRYHLVTSETQINYYQGE